MGPPIEAVFKGETHAERIAEVEAMLARIGVGPHEVLVRVYNSGLTGKVRRTGTDRTGIDRCDHRAYRADLASGFDRVLEERKLHLEDGTYLTPAQDFLQRHAATAFAGDANGLPAHRVALSFYHRPRLELIPDELGNLGDFYIFRDPSRKLDALLGFISPPPAPVDLTFQALPTVEAKLADLHHRIEAEALEGVDAIEQHLRDLLIALDEEATPSSASGLRAELELLKERLTARKVTRALIDDLATELASLRDQPDEFGGTPQALEVIASQSASELTAEDLHEGDRRPLKEIFEEARRRMREKSA